MPAPNDLTPEEEAEFAQHGVTSAGPGREPLSEAPVEQQQAQPPAQPEPVQEQPPQAQQPRDPATGQFASSQQQAQPEPGQEQPPAQPPEPVEEGGEPKMVPLAALHEARQRANAVAQRARLAETRLNAILARQQPEQQEAMPDINTDPAGYIVALEQRLQKFEQERTETVQNQQIDSSINADEESFASVRPDYPQASDYFVQSRAQELLAFHPPEQAQKIMLQEARTIARAAWERGQSVGEVIYNLAQARGYNPGMPPRVPFNGQPPQQQQNPPPQQQQGGPRPADVVASVTNAQAASRSLSGGTGASPANLNAAALLEMDENDFAKWLGEGPDATRRFANIG
jgi:hypothetical protein